MDYNQIKKYYDEHETAMTNILNNIEMRIVKARDKDNIPVYMTRARVKSIESTYLKTKRKNKTTIMSITDLIGLRILCLFEQDIFKVYTFILNLCDNEVYTLKEILIFGWKKESSIGKSSFKKEYLKHERYENLVFEDIDKDNGYQSIHFVGQYHDYEENIIYPIEIQLRTLLQDVWGELEHKLAYKQKNPHPFIKNSFIRLSNYLDTNDMLITHLKDIIDDSTCTTDKIPFSPGNVFQYEEERLPKVFLTNIKLKKTYQRYKSIIYQDNLFQKKYITQAKNIYTELITQYHQEEPNLYDDEQFIYWKDMEEAFFASLENNLDRSKKIYKQYLNTDSYVSQFRLGQIYFSEGDLLNALKNFDKCLSTINEKCLHINNMKVHVNIALVFWDMGREYLTSSISSIKKAIESCESNIDSYTNRDLEKLYNSACWYYLECSLDTRCNKKEDFKSHDHATYYYKKILEIVVKLEEDNEIPIRNTYDTLSWYNYQKYIESDKENTLFIEKAYQYSQLMNSATIANVQYYSHDNLQNNHIHKIKCEYLKVYPIES